MKIRLPSKFPEHVTQMKVSYLVAQTQMGVTEIVGRKHNPKIVEYAQSCTLQAQDDETYWCAEFVNWAWIIAGLIMNPESMLLQLRKRKYEEQDIELFVKSAKEITDQLKAAGVVVPPARGGSYVVCLPTRSALARSFISFADGTSSPSESDLVVLSRGNNGLSGHIGWVVSRGFSYVRTLAGNKNNSVCVADEPRRRVLAYRTQG